tara:strand:- start:1120 stop:1416 length:297 start_codon:yes stop_codon:yes gene_type:complete
MAKQGPLGTAEKFYIEQNWNGENLEEICTALDRSKRSVKKHVAHCKKNEPELFNAKNLMAIREGVAIMTQDASTMADDIRGRGLKPRPKCVFVINEGS